MQYTELIQFESLESVIEIRDANQANKAKQLISTYVISNEMAFRLTNLVFIQLQLDALTDNKGLLIIGNYGTGKSHLMAVISSLAENAEYINYLNHPKVAQAAQAIAGKFHVLRTEIGATTMSLRDMLTAELENYLNQIGIQFKFPPADSIINNKDAFEKMMAAFQARYPGQGLLLVVDELLEYLRTRTDQALILDLSFLREIGEVCKDLPFRFIAGLQETIFDNQRFEFVANALRRVKDRFEQILITRQDIKFVVAKRLLKKNAQQKTKIEQHLSRFAPYYDNMLDRLSEFISLFPVHPDYIDIFERLTLIEKREILKTLERSVQGIAATQVPETLPGLLTYDNYWNFLRENPSFRAIPEIREVIECSRVLENRLQQAFTRPAYKAMAIRIIHGLSIHRLTTHDINAPVGMTAQELRDSLCLYQTGIEELGGKPADNLLSIVETVLREILKTVNRQFISTNPENGQYYIDFKKNYDFDAIIEKRAESLEPHQLDRQYYAALRQVMEVSDTPSGKSQSWTYEIEWRSHKITRQGYLIFGTPNRATLSMGDENFLLYFLPLNTNYQLSVVNSKNEVFFRLGKTDDLFNQILRLYTAVADLISTSSGHAKSVYEAKSKIYLREVLQWLQEHKATAFEVTYQGKTLKILDWLEEVKDENFQMKNDPALFTPHPSLLANFRDLIDLVADICLENFFSELAPEYPVFPILISHENLPQLAQEALRSIANGNNKQGILIALDLVDEPNRSKYAQAILKQLYQKPDGQVLNRAELLPTPYHLEPELVMVLIAALVYTGELVLVTPKQTYNATNFANLATLPINELLAFRHLERPKDFNLPALKALFELLGLPKGLEVALTKHEAQAVQQLQTKIGDILGKLVQAQQGLGRGFYFWGKAVLSKAELQHYRDGLTETKNFLESLQAYSTPLKFKNFRYTAGEVTAQWSGLKILQNVKHLIKVLTELNPSIAYLTTADATLAPQHPWKTEMAQIRDKVLTSLSDVRQRNNTGFTYYTQQQLMALQKSYIQAYLKLHQQARLDVQEQQNKQQLLQDKRLINLKKLSRIPFLASQQLQAFEKRLNQLKTCYALTEQDLIAQTICPHCGYKPIYDTQAQEMKLAQFNQSLERLYQKWTQTLLSELENAGNQRELLKTENRTQLENFLTRRCLPEEITRTFIEALQEGLSGLVKVSVNIEDLQKALLRGGSPMTVIEMQKRFINYMNSLTKGKELSQVRVVLE